MKKKKYQIKKFLQSEYVKKSAPRIAKELGCESTIIYHYLKKYNIPIRSMSDSLKKKYLAIHTKRYYCIEAGCTNKISDWNWKYGKKRCLFCARKGPNNPNWRGGVQCVEGYAYIKKPNHSRANFKGLVLRAVLVLEKHLKRSLKKNEIIYRINQLRGDDRLENLKLFKNRSAYVSFLNRVTKTGQPSPKIQGKGNGMYGKISHGRWGKYKGIWMRSSWEILYAKWLNKNKINWEYEPKVFDLGKTTYRPDFYLPKTNEYIEIKGYWRKANKQRFNLFKKLYPQINIRVLERKNLEKIGITLKKKRR